MNHTLDLLSDNSERVPYNDPDVPFYARKGRISNYLNYAASSHWHDDVEFSVLLSGRMAYNLNGAIHMLEQGEGVFVNSKQFHSNYSADGTDCEYLCVLFHPVLLCANRFLERTCVAPILSNGAFPYAILHQDVSWHAELLSDVRRVYQLSNERETASDLLIQSLFFHIWSILYAHMPDGVQPPVRSGSRLSAFREMLAFLQKHYHERIALADIALAGKVCPSNCCLIFDEYLHQTPIQYLIYHRLNKSAELLKDTTLSVTEIALASGFSGASYYAETFRKHFGLSPTQYRKRADPGPETQS